MVNRENGCEVALQLHGLKKRYKLGQIGGGTLTADLQSWWARIRGKEDPNVQVDTDQRLFGKTFMALNGIDLTVYKGEALGIIGTNGAGKSTLLKILSRVTGPTEGEIDIFGRIASMLEVGTGFHGEMTGRENIYMNGAILGMNREEIDSKMEDIIEFSEVRDFIDTPVKRYSSGMYVKLAFSVAAHLDSEILIMDEVLAVGDINFQQKCLKKMREVAKQEGKTVLYVSHNMNTIRQLCDRCIVLNQGKIIFDGDVEEAITVYSNTKIMEMKTSYDLSNVERDGEVPDNFHFQSIELLNNNLDEKTGLEFILTLMANKPTEHLILRIAVNNENGTAVGISFSKELSVHEGNNRLRFSLDTTKLAPGQYTCQLVAAEYIDGTQTREDSIVDAFCFSVDELEPWYNMKWNKRFWGDARLPVLEYNGREE